MVLVDTSVWIDHFHKPVSKLLDLLESRQVLIHPFILGELVAGQIPKRTQTISDLKLISQAQQVPNEWVYHFIEQHKLHGGGLSFTDLHILASVFSDSCELFTRDKKLNQIYLKLRTSK
jgi:predicted nucleic acid-binding protein